MKFADMETFVVANPPPGFGGRYFVFVKLTTDDGIVGYGEHYGPRSGRRWSRRCWRMSPRRC